MMHSVVLAIANSGNRAPSFLVLAQVSTSRQMFGEGGTLLNIDGIRVPRKKELCSKFEFDLTVFRIVENSRHHTEMATRIPTKPNFSQLVKNCMSCGGKLNCPVRACKQKRGANSRVCPDVFCADLDQKKCVKPRVLFAPTDDAFAQLKEQRCEEETSGGIDFQDYFGYLYQRECNNCDKDGFKNEEFNFIYSLDHLVDAVKAEKSKTRTVYFHSYNLKKRQAVRINNNGEIEIGPKENFFVVLPSSTDMDAPTSDMFSYDGVVHSVDRVRLKPPTCSSRGAECSVCSGDDCLPDGQDFLVVGLTQGKRCDFRESAIEYLREKYSIEHARFKFVKREKENEWLVEYVLYFENDVARDAGA